MTEKQTYMSAVDLYGNLPQTDVAIEEMAELTKALIKHRRNPTRETLENIREEMADVHIMMGQLKLIYGNYDEWLEHKLRRLQQRVTRRD